MSSPAMACTGPPNAGSASGNARSRPATNPAIGHTNKEEVLRMRPRSLTVLTGMVAAITAVAFVTASQPVLKSGLDPGAPF